MKKIILSIATALVAGSGCAYAQTVEATDLTPKKGDWAVGVDVIPLLRTIGGAFNNDKATPVGGNPFVYDEMYTRPDVAIMGKYMVSDKWSVNVNFGLNVRNNWNRAYVGDDKALALNPDSEAKVTDTENINRTGGTLTVGAEYRLGQRRVQGIFGVGLMAGISNYSRKYSYGNKITELNQNPTTSMRVHGAHEGYRVIEAKNDGVNGALGVYGSAGAEWMITRQIALGAKVDLYLYGSFSHNGYIKSEGWNQAYGRVDTHTDLVTPGNSSINFGTGNIGASLYCMFYF